MARTSSESRLVLASSSPRRRQLLAEAGIGFVVVPPPIPEPAELMRGLSPVGQAEALAYFKARAVAEQCPNDYCLGADTVVAVGDRVLGKATNAEEAARMLRDLSGTRHRVITGLALLRGPCERWIGSDTTFVTMKDLTSEEIADYVNSGEWEGKAGAYAIQDSADKFILNLDGSFTNVVGLPMELLGKMLRKIPALACEIQDRPPASPFQAPEDGR